MEANLIFLSGDQKGESTTLKPEGTSIGRETDNDIIIQNSEISRHHARILEKDGKWIFKDLGSSHGVTVNDIPIKDGQQELNPGDIILIGRHKLKFEPGIGDATMVNPPSKEEVRETLAEVKEKEKEAPPADGPASTEATPVSAATGGQAGSDKEEEKKAEETPEEKKEEPKDEEKESKPEEPKEKPVEEVKKTEPKTTSPSAPAPEKKGNSKAFYGCGGCGCLLALILLIAGVVCIALGADSHMSEAAPVGVVLTPIAFIIGIIGLILLIVGMVVGKKKD